jgi:hypothetical protein
MHIEQISNGWVLVTIKGRVISYHKTRDEALEALRRWTHREIEIG